MALSSINEEFAFELFQPSPAQMLDDGKEITDALHLFSKDV
jgi:hypothetical protein